jgi:Domain of unknown function DUF11/PASTA domain
MRILRVCAVGLGLLFAFSANAAASTSTTLGSTTVPSGAMEGACSEAPYPTVVQSAQDPTTPYFVPAGGGVITQWQTNVTGDTPGAPLTFAVVSPSSGGDYTVVGADSETIPDPLPASGVATFTLASPLAVEAGDTLALYSSSPDVACFFGGGSTPLDANIVAVDDAAPPPSAGQTLTPAESCAEAGVSGCTLNVAANLVQSEDAGVTTSAVPSNGTAGYPALLSSTVSNGGPASAPITFTDTVPSGLTINAAAAGQGACSMSGQTVTCTITGLPPGQSAPVDVVVTPTATGSYTNTVSVAASLTDPNAANNTASATLTVGASASARKCAVPKLKGVKLSLAKQLLHPLGCKAGPVRHAHSKSVHKGFVIGTRPGPGTYAAGRKITLLVSSGPAKKHHK